MLNSKKRQNFDAPIRLALTEKGLELFFRSQRSYEIFTTLDQKRNYGLHLPQFNFATLKSFLEGHLISKAEIPFCDFAQTRDEIPDLTRLFLNSIFHQRFADEVLKLVFDSRIFDHWMNAQKEDRYSYEFFSNSLPDEFLKKYYRNSLTPEQMQQRIIDLLRPHVMSEGKWSAAQQNITVLSAKKFLKKTLNSVWFGLSLIKQRSQIESYLEAIADELWKYLKILRKCELIADVVRRITEEQLYLRLKDLVRNSKDPISVTAENAEQINERLNLLSAVSENGQHSILWAMNESKVGGLIFKRLDIYILLEEKSLNALINATQRFSQRETLTTDYDEFCQKYLKRASDVPVACRTAVFLEKILKTEGINFSYTFLQSEKKWGIIQLRVQI